MPTYAIGDVQGCYDDLRRLLDAIRYDPANDILWSAGDIVNRGPQSLDVLRFFYDLKHQAVVVLGNHELHLLTVAYAFPERMRPGDTLTSILNAPDREELLTWLRHCPFLHHDHYLGFTLVHAGFPPQWDLLQACRCASELEDELRGQDYPQLLRHIYGDSPREWRDDLTGWDRLRFISNCFTRIRYCTPNGELSMKNKGKPRLDHIYAVNEDRPWFMLPHRASQKLQIVFGHWSTLGFYADAKNGIYGMDSGCLWGGELTAMRLEDKQVFQVKCQRKRAPHKHS
jgi:bis(5'-nucleosyl)-tetraphosphatase (symmetrical)